MNPLDWDAVRTLQRNWHPNYQNDFHNSMENSSRTSNNWDPQCDYSRHTADEAHSSRMVVNVDRKRLSPPPHNFYMKEPDLEDPDGAPLEIEEDDPELIRKRRELREIEERIMLKKAAIALKTVEPFVRKTTPPDFSPDKQPATCKGASLKDRVNVILQQRHPFGFFSKVHLPKERMNSSSLQDDHPLKRRVQALMKQRSIDPCVLSANREVPDVIQPSTSQRVTSAATEDSSVNEGFQRFLRVLNKSVDMDAEPSISQSATSPVMEDSSVSKGFQRFLSVLNKGVDMDFLSRIVNDDSEDIPLGKEVPNIQPPAAENKSDPPVSSESQRSNSGASLPVRVRPGSGKKTDLPSKERSLNERLSLPDDDENKNDRGYSSSSQSRSPLAVRKKKREEDKPKVKEQSEQLQNILKTLGLSLEVEDMNKLADRTQERLYGKKHEDTRTDSRGEQQRGTPRRYSNSSSSSSSFSSRSRSFSCSPSRSRSRDSRRRRERSCSRDRRKDELTQQDGNQYSEDAQSYRDKDKNVSTEISSYQHPYPQNQTYPPPHPAAFPTYPDYTLPHGSQYVAYHSDTYSHATNSYLPHSQAAIPPSNYSSHYAYPGNAYNQFPVQPHAIYPGTEDINLLLNPDLSTSEGQTGSYSGPRCLQVVSTKQQRAGSCLKRLTKGHKRRGNPETCWKRQQARFLRKKEERKQQKIAERMARQSALSVQMVEAPQPNNDETNSKAEQSEEEKRPPTEEEVKANLRKKLEAFNQKVKQKVSQPTPSITSGDLW